MNLKSRFFKKPWQSKDASTRAEAVRDGHEPELKAELPRLAQHDESAAVRLAALKRINSEPFWLDARLREKDADILASADAFLAREVGKTNDETLRESRLQWLARIDGGDVIRRLAREAVDPALRRAALARVDAQGFLGDCYGSESDDELAAEILNRIDQPSTLERLSEQLRKQRKKRAQAAATRLRAIRVAAGELEADQSEANALVSSMERLARGEFEADRAARLAALQAEWAALSDVAPALATRFKGAAAIVRASIGRTREDSSTETPAAQPVVEEAGPDANLAKAAERIRSVIRKADKRVAPGELLGDWDRAWNAIAKPSEPDQALKDDILPLLRELQAQIAQARPADKPKQAQAKPGDELDPMLDQIAETLESGDIARSHELIRKARSRFNALPPRQRPRAAGGRLQRMEGRLKEMRDYQHWSHNEHRDELIAQIEAIPESGQHPDAISVLLKQAREEWQRLEQLEVLPGDRKRFASPPGQWRRFQAACKQAFETAKPYFEKRQEVQAENHEQLKRFLAMGKELAGNEQAEEGQLRDFLGKSRLAIRRLDDLPPKTRGRAAAQLRELMGALSGRLDEHQAEIERVKRRLIAEARALAHEKDNKLAIDKAKALQAEWQRAGRGRRKLEQKLWEEFREPIDPLFEQLKGEREELKQAEREAQAELKRLCEQAEELARADDAELDNAAGRLAGLSADWASRDGRSGKLKQRFEKAEAALEKRLQQRKERQRQADRARREQLAEAVQAIAAARLQNHDADVAGQVPAALDDDTGLDQQLRERAAALADPALSSDSLGELLQQGDEQGRQVAVEMEFLAGLETPEEERKRRMDYQVQRLAQRMSERHAQPDLGSELDQLMGRWYQSLPHTPEVHGSLVKRLAAGRKIIEDMVGL